MFILPTHSIDLILESDCLPVEAVKERIKALKTTIHLAENNKARLRINGEINYLENILMEKELSNDR